ncbi:hypothetical protein ACFQT0_12490 [Hymenobacter humi]|uniref:Uncharacterized protein n=1 Tax=Hymenobacter humi TaxID=1411620 RepID=A0ABW2U3S2_9BACT
MEPEVAATGHGIPMHGEQPAPPPGRFGCALRCHGPAQDGPLRPPARHGRCQWGALGTAARGEAVGGRPGRSGPGPRRGGAGQGGQWKKNDGRGKSRKEKLSANTSDSSYRAWYRDSPAEHSPSGPDWQYRRPGTFADQPAASSPSAGKSYADLRYSDQRSRRIETQYP